MGNRSSKKSLYKDKLRMRIYGYLSRVGVVQTPQQLADALNVPLTHNFRTRLREMVDEGQLEMVMAWPERGRLRQHFGLAYWFSDPEEQ